MISQKLELVKLNNAIEVKMPHRLLLKQYNVYMGTEILVKMHFLKKFASVQN